MRIINFDAANPFYQYPTGAVRTGQSVTLRVLLPRSLGVSACRLYVKSYYGQTECRYFSWKSTDGSTEVWELTLSFQNADIYFYSFGYTTPWGDSRMKRLENSVQGGIEGQGEWQLTVYAPYNAPKALTGGIIYQIFPDRFCNSGVAKQNVPADRVYHGNCSEPPFYLPDEKGNVPNNDYYGGDLLGIVSKLDYLSQLGVTCLYLNPICEAHSNHRYDTADYGHIDPLLGTDEDFMLLCREAHKRGISVLFDGVYSHTGADSVYFNKENRYPCPGAWQAEASPYDSWYKFNADKTQYECWWGVKILPEVNENEPSFTEFITGENGVIARYMQMGADGVRLDVADELPDAFLQAVNRAVKRFGNEKIVMGEVWEDATNKESYGSLRRYFNGSQLDCVMNYPFRDAIVGFLLTGNAQSFMERVQSIVLHYPPQNLNLCMNLLSTHDTARILTVLTGLDYRKISRKEQGSIPYTKAQINRAQRLLKAAVCLQYTLPGVPSVYYGDEAGMFGGMDPYNRAFFPWERINGENLSFYRQMGQIRKQYEVLKEGGFYPLSAILGTVAYLRYSPGLKRLATIVNKNPEEITYELNADMQDMQVLTGGQKTGGSVKIPAETAVLLGDI